MRKSFMVMVIAEGSTTRINVSSIEHIGTASVEMDQWPDIELFLPGETESRELLRDALVHLVEHL